MIEGELKSLVKKALESRKIEEEVEIELEHPADLSHGDFSTNIAFKIAKRIDKKPSVLAKELLEHLEENKGENISKVEIAGPGFINFYLSAEYISHTIDNILDKTDDYGKGELLKNKKVIVEYTDPNPLKEFHAGHLMSNTIGESLSRLVEFQGAEIKRANYQGDVGMHIAKAVWGAMYGIPEKMPAEDVPINEKIRFWNDAYVSGNTMYEEASRKEGEVSDDAIEAKKKIIELNDDIFAKSNPEVNEVYEKGKSVSLEHFAKIYERLGTRFNYFFFESEVADFGKQTVEKNIGEIFEKSEGAIVYKGKKDGLHTRVFINSKNLPTYEAKELGLAKIKYDKFPYDLSIVVTGNEIDQYFRVLLSAMRRIFPELEEKTKHISHGMLKLPSGKMSSRKGNVIYGEELLNKSEELIKEKITDRKLPEKQKDEIARKVSVGAIKYSILKTAVGGDIIFDFEKSISFVGDSGPYLQYSYTRANSVVEKSHEQKLFASANKEDKEISELERLLYRFPRIVEKSYKELSSHHIALYLIEIAGAFNAYYANNKILEAGGLTPYRLALTESFMTVMKNGLYLLGIKAPEKM